MDRIDPTPWERRTLKFRFERDLFVALCGGALFYSYLDDYSSVNNLLLSLLITSALYLFYRWLHIGFNKSFFTYFKQLAIPSLICILSLFLIKGLSVSFYINLGLSLILCYFYNFRIGDFRLRKVPYLKSLIIAFLWVWILVYLPLTISEFSGLALYILLLENFMFILALTIMYDIYDIEEDEHYGIQTFVNYKHSKHAVRNVILLLAVSNLPGIYYILNSSAPNVFILPNLIPCLAAITLLVKYGKVPKKGLLLIWDGLILVKALILILILSL